MKIVRFIVCLFFGVLVAGSASAAGIGVTPKALEITQSTSQVTEAEVFVHNTGEGEAQYQVVSDDWSKLITVNPAEFRLAPGEARSIVVEFSQLPVGTHQTYLSVIADDLTQESLPKTGVKIPINLSIAKEGAGVFPYTPVIVGAFLIALALLLLAGIYAKRRSFAQKALDQVQEAVLQKVSPKRYARHYLKHHKLLLISAFALVIAGVLLAASFYYTATAWQVPSSAIHSSQQIRFELQDPQRTRVYFLDASEQQYTAFSALQKVAEMYTIPLEFDPPNEMGVFVTMIGGHRNGEDQKYWVYEIDGQTVPVAADKLIMRPGHELVWKFVQPSSN